MTDDDLAPARSDLPEPADPSGHNGGWSRWAPWAVLAVSALLHLVALGHRPLAHDEAIDASFSWQARTFGVMRYDPVYHGPLRFYLEGPVLALFGTTAGWTRLVAASAGIATTAIIAWSRTTLGRVGAPVAALAFTVSPTALTVTRTGREDSLVALVSVALLVLVARVLTAPRPWQLVAGGALVAASFGLKETTFIFGAVGALFLVVVAIRAATSATSASRAAVVRLAALGRLPWMWSLMAFLALFVLIFTSGLRYAAGLESGLLDGIRYWLDQHAVGRGSQRWFFYGVVYLAYEWLVLALAVVGVVVTLRRRSMVGAWFATMAVGQFAVYSWAGEKFAWLAIHPLLPTILLGGLGAQAVADRVRAPARRRLAAVALGVAAAGTLLVAIRPAITDGDDPRELLVTVQTSRAVPAINDRLRDGQAAGEIERILVDERDSGSWPWAWYLHGMDGVEYVTVDPTQPLPAGYDAYLVSASTDPPAVPDGFEIARFPLRRWWLPDYGSASIGDVATWLVTREPWSDLGSSDQYLITRTG